MVDGLDPLAAVLRWFELSFGRRSAGFSWRLRGEQLRRAIRRADRYGNFGRGGAGVGLGAVLDWIEAAAEREHTPSLERRAPVATAAPFILRLDRESKRWRHNVRGCSSSCRHEKTYQRRQRS